MTAEYEVLTVPFGTVLVLITTAKDGHTNARRKVESSLGFMSHVRVLWDHVTDIRGFKTS